jgi:hypothetical protein
LCHIDLDHHPAVDKRGLRRNEFDMPALLFGRGIEQIDDWWLSTFQ